MQTFDIAIIGGGIAGISLAYFLNPHRSVVVLEQESELGYHSTGRSAAEFTLRDNAPAVNALARASHGFLASPPDGFADVPLLTERGSVILGTHGKEALVRKRFDAAKALGAAVEWLDDAAMLARAPMLDTAYATAAYFDPDYWDIDVDALLQAYARHARRHGAQILEKCGFAGARRDGGTWRIETGEKTISAGILVNAAGGWADGVAALSGVAPAGIVPHRRMAITVDLPEGIDASRLPEINEVEDMFYFKPEGGRLLASPADETPCEPADVQPEELDIAYAAHYVEEATTLAVRRVFKSWAGMRSFSADRLPVIGPATDEPSFFWLAGLAATASSLRPRSAASLPRFSRGARCPNGWPGRASGRRCSVRCASPETKTGASWAPVLFVPVRLRLPASLPYRAPARRRDPATSG